MNCDLRGCPKTELVVKGTCLFFCCNGIKGKQECQQTKDGVAPPGPYCFPL